MAENKKTPGEEIGAALFKLAKPVYKEAKRMERERNRYKRPSSYYERPPRWSQKEMVFSVLPQAMRNAGSSFSARDLYSPVTPSSSPRYGGWHYLGVEDGGVERYEAVPCRRCPSKEGGVERYIRPHGRSGGRNFVALGGRDYSE